MGNKREIILKELITEYLDSDVTSGEFIYSTEISIEHNEQDVRNGIQDFLNWDKSKEKFNLEKGDKYWIVTSR